MDKYIGKRLDGRYEIREIIGFGGMAVVFKAFDLAQNKDVAIKILKDEYLTNEDFKRRFRNESKAIAVLSHPNIVTVFDVGFGETVQYIVMEYIDGITLKEYISQQKLVKWKEAVHFTVQILRALQHAHDNGIVHRDIKPQNIMLLRDGTIKVMDFGIARFERGDAGGRTVSNKALGSVHYISPEQARGEQTDQRTDLYSVGIMLYEMLTGAVPFDGDTPVGIALKHMQNQAVALRTLNPEIPVGLDEIVTRAMQKDPELRYQTASEMLKDIEELKRNPDVEFGYRYLNEDGSTKYFDPVSGTAMQTTIANPKGEETAVAKRRSYVMPVLTGIAATCVIVMIFAVVIFFRGLSDKPDDINLPDLVGKTVEEAKELCPTLNLIIGEEVMSKEFAKGLIVSTNPQKDMPVKEGADITLSVSSGIVASTMPDLVNYKKADAIAELEKLGVAAERIHTIDKFDETVTPGYVISTTPQADTEIGEMDEISIFVSMGEADLAVTVPDVRTLMENEARDKLIALDLLVSVASVDSAEKKGTVVGQSIVNEKVAKNSTITLEVSNGKTPEKEMDVSVTMPSGGANEKFTFVGLLDGKKVGTKKANPSLVGSISFKVSGTKTDSLFVVQVNSQTYAAYRINFETEEVVLESMDEELLKAVATAPVSFAVAMPQGAVNKQLTFNVYLEGELLETKNVNPSLSNGFDLSITGKGVGTVGITVNIDGSEMTYAQYSVDFDKGTHSLIEGPYIELLISSEPTDGTVDSSGTSSEESLPAEDGAQ